LALSGSHSRSDSHMRSVQAKVDAARNIYPG
jgi:hypothetical protein